MAEELISVEVAYALPERQSIITVTLTNGSTIEQAIQASKVLEHYPDIDKSAITVGIFGNACKLDTKLKTGDRIEIYRPLHHDPKEARRQRALKS